MIYIAGLYGLCAFMVIIGLYKKNKGAGPGPGIDRIMDYTVDESPSVKRKDDKKSKSIRHKSSRYKHILGKERTDAYSLEALKAGLPLSGDEWLLVKTAVPLLSGLALGLLFQSLFSGIFGLLIGLVTLRIYVKVRMQKRLKAFTNQLNDALGIMSNSLRAGYSFLQSVNSVSREMPDPIANEFKRLLKELSLGQDTDTALNNLAGRVESEDLSLVVRAILIQKETGGNLAEILDTISTTIRDRVKIQGEIKTLTAQGRLSGMVVSLMPLVLIGIMYMINPGYISVLFTHPLGRLMLIFAGVNEVVGMLIIRKIVSIEV